MLSDMGWLISRYMRERRDLRKRMRKYRNRTGTMMLCVLLLLAAICLWILFPPHANSEAMYALTVDDYANVREQPSKHSVDAGDVYAGEVVRGLDYSQGWVLVEAPIEAGQGWVRADLLTLDGVPTGKYTNASGGRVRIRREPDGKPVGWLEAGHTVNVERWVDVDGAAWAYTKRGYIDGSCLEVAE